MSQFLPAYKLTVFKAAVDDPTELTPLVPVAGAIHSDAFQVTTLSNLGGFKPYLGLPQGRKGTYTPANNRFTNEDLTFRLLDMKSGTSGGNLQRWVTAFLGNVSGSMNLMNRRVEVWESLDGGTTWNAFYEGRVSNAQLDDALWYSLTVKAPADELNIEAFKYRPAAGVTNYAQTSLIPMGLSDTYAPFTSSVGLNATFTVSGGTGSLATDVSDYRNALSTVLVGYLQRGITTLSAAQEYAARIGGIDTNQNITLADPSGSAGSRFRLLVSSGSTTGEFIVTNLTFALHTPNVFRVKTIQCAEVPSGSDPGWKALSTFNGKAVQCKIVPNTEPIGEKNPLFIWNKHPGALFREVLSGSYGYLNSASRAPTRQPIAYDSASFAAFESGSNYETPRFKLTKPIKIVDFVEKYLCPLGMGYRIDPVVSGSHVISKIAVFDSRIPASSSFASLPALTDVDLASLDCTWQAGTPISTINLKYYQEYPLPVDSKTVAQNNVYDIDPWLIAEAEIPVIEFIPENLAGSSTAVTIDALGSRSPSMRTYTDFLGRTARIQDSSHTDILNYQTDRFAFGAPTFGLKCRRTTTVTGLKIGQWVLVQVSVIPDPTSHQRGGVRVCQVTEKSEDGLFVNLQFSDAGRNVLNLAPSIGTVATAASFDGTNCVNVPVTAITGQLLLLQMAEVASGSARPAEIDPSWFSVLRKNVTSNSATNYLVTGLRANQTYWFRARTSTQDATLPSVWAYAATGYTLGILTAPSSVAISNITATGARVSWNNNGDNASDILISLGAPSSSAVLNSVAVQYPGSTLYDLTNLNNAAPSNFIVGVTHIANGAKSTTATTTFTLSASLATCPSMSGLRVYTTGYSTDNENAGTSVGSSYVLTGVPLLLTPSSLDYDVEVQRAPDVAGSPGTYSVIDTVARQALSLGGNIYRDFLPLDGSKYWYRSRHIRTGFNSGSFIAAVSGSAGKLSTTVTAPSTADLPPGSITDLTPFASSITPPLVVSVLPASGLFVGQLVVLTTDQKLYRWTGSAWTAAVPTVDLTGQVTTAQIAANAVAAGQLAQGAVTADKISALLGGGNQVQDSGFELNSGTYWTAYNNGPETMTLTFPTTSPYRGTRSAKCTWTVTNTSTKGIFGGTGNVVFKPNTSYVISWYAKVTTAWSQGMTTAWNVVPTIVVGLNPNLSTSYQRYSARITWGATVDPNFFITISGLATANDLFIDCVQIEEGEVLTAYAPKPDEILPSTITTTEIADNSITTPKIVAGAVVAGSIASHTITAAQIAASTITASEIAAATITAAQIAAGTISTTELAAGAVTAAKIAANTITAAQIAAGTITANEIAADTITAGQIAAGAVSTSELAAGAVTAAKITAGTITVDRLVANSIDWNYTVSRTACLLSMTTGVTIPGTGVYTNVSWDTEDSDPAALHTANDKFITIPSSLGGYVWDITCQATFKNPATAGYTNMRLIRNSDSKTLANASCPNSTVSTAIHTTVCLNVKVVPSAVSGESYYIQVSQTSGVNETMGDSTVGDSAFFQAIHLW